MKVVSVISTKGGVGKTTTAANLGGMVADAGFRVLLLDLDVQPTLSSYFKIASQAEGGAFEFLAADERRPEKLISHTAIHNLELILSNDPKGRLGTLLLHAPDGRLRLRHLLRMFASDYDLLLIDTQGARSVLIEMAVLASDIALCPVTPEFLGARELQRGTLQLIRELAPFRDWGITPPPLVLLLNRMPAVSSNARLIRNTLTQLYQNDVSVKLLKTVVPAIEVYHRASMMSLPVHRVERHKPSRRIAPAALDTMRTLAGELFPEWESRLAQVTGTERDLVLGRG